MYFGAKRKCIIHKQTNKTPDMRGTERTSLPVVKMHQIVKTLWHLSASFGSALYFMAIERIVLQYAISEILRQKIILHKYLQKLLSSHLLVSIIAVFLFLSVQDPGKSNWVIQLSITYTDCELFPKFLDRAFLSLPGDKIESGLNLEPSAYRAGAPSKNCAKFTK